MSIPQIVFKNSECARKYVGALLEEELGKENLNPLDVYLRLLTINHEFIANPYTLAVMVASKHMSKIGFSDSALYILFSQISDDGIHRMESKIVMADPSTTWIDLQIELANAIIDFFNTLE